MNVELLGGVKGRACADTAAIIFVCLEGAKRVDGDTSRCLRFPFPHERRGLPISWYCETFLSRQLKKSEIRVGRAGVGERP